ncbi:hypothetical protein A3Q56_00704 [Intoshia linei]|uniref:Dynamin-like GTPase OPA1 C-terminal domain-containing protein n=1 Tax=Intoshia linei TaxID=1819745 RepID=A0A177BCW7_9BILA|nr:hypothetical protein A3Q56_00704 [Intoshia linei]
MKVVNCLAIDDNLELKTRNKILDDLAKLSDLSDAFWDNSIKNKLKEKISAPILNNIYLPIVTKNRIRQDLNLDSIENFHGKFSTDINIALKTWIEKELASTCISVGKSVLEDALLNKFNENKTEHPYHREINNTKKKIIDETVQNFVWDNKALSILKFHLHSVINEQRKMSLDEWNRAGYLMSDFILDNSRTVNMEIDKLIGINPWSAIFKRKPSEINYIFDEIKTFLPGNGINIDNESLSVLRKQCNLEGYSIHDDVIKKCWNLAYKKWFWERSLNLCSYCRKGFYFYQHDINKYETVRENSTKFELSCDEIEIFDKIDSLVTTGSRLVKQQLVNAELNRIQRLVEDNLTQIEQVPDTLGNLFDGERLRLSEKIHRVYDIRVLLDEMVQSLSNKN